MKTMRLHVWIGLAFVGAAACAFGQWINQPMAGAPRTPDGKIDMTGPVPRLDGHPDLSGIWQVPGEPRGEGRLFGLGESENSRYFINILSDYAPGEEPLTPLGQQIWAANSASGGAASPPLHCLPDGVPHGDLLPEPFKFIQTPGVMVMLFEVGTTFRQIFTDGREQLVDPSPAWNGYSVGHWEGDTLVVDTAGFNDLSWLDARGHGHSGQMRVEERFHRRDYGHLEVSVTITDPLVFTEPVSVSFVENLLPDTDLFEHYCLENETDAEHQVGNAGR